MKLQYFVPYLCFFVPTVVCTIFLIPRDWRMILGFSCCLAGMTAAYFFGIRNVVLDLTGGIR